MSIQPIVVENISKRYRIGIKDDMHDTLFSAVTSWLTNPLNNFKKVRSLSSFNDNNHSKDIIWALKNVSVKISEGEVLGIIGGNGAGKSTFLKILAGITEPTQGKAKIYGRIGSLLEVGTGFHPELTGRENLYLSGAILGMSKIEIQKKFDQIVDFSGIEKFIDTPVKRYSSGMRVRLAFSVAAHLEPEVLLIDEVLAVGDMDFQKKCLGKMDSISKSGRTVIFVSHNLSAVNDLCSHGLVLEKGEVKFHDRVDKAIKFYLSERMQEGIGEKTWSKDNRPGSKGIEISAIRVISDGIITNNPSLDKEIEIEIDYQNNIDNENFFISIHVVNEAGVVAFSSSNFEGASIKKDIWAYKKYEKGKYKTKCSIPRYLLNDGIYSIHLFINKKIDWSAVVNVQDAISFKVSDSIKMRSDFSGKWVGVVRPKLGWETHKIN